MKMKGKKNGVVSILHFTIIYALEVVYEDCICIGRGVGCRWQEYVQ